MAVRLVFLGRLEEAAGGPERMVSVSGPGSLEQLLGSLEPELAAALRSDRVRTALNGVLADRDAAIRDGDEVAFLPPVSGG